MDMIKTFRQQFQDEQKLQSNLAEGWGYQLDTTLLDSNYQKQKINTSPVVAKITLRKFAKQIVKTERIRQVEDQINALQNERLLRQIRQSKQVRQESSNQQKSEIITLMEKVIQEYNDIIEHKHIQNKRVQIKVETQNNALSQQKDDLELLLKDIKQKETQLNSGDLTQQIKINRQIAQTYRRYKNKLQNINNKDMFNKNGSLHKQISLSCSKMKKHQSETFQKLNLKVIPDPHRIFSMNFSNSSQKNNYKSSKDKNQSNLNQKQIKLLKQLQHKRYLANKKRQNRELQQMDVSNKSLIQSTRISQKKAFRGQKQLQKIIDSPYVNKKQTDDYKQLQNKVKSSNQALQLWRIKMNDFHSNSRLAQQPQNAKKMKQASKIQQAINLTNRQSQIYQQIEKYVRIVDISTPNNITKDKKAKQKKVYEQQKQSIFSQLLRKKNNKFNRLWGTKILVRYDPLNQAKSLLKGQADRNHKDVSQSPDISPIKQINDQDNSDVRTKSMERTKLTPLSARGNEDELYDWKQEKGDEQNYWRMCKNQKINLLLKRK